MKSKSQTLLSYYGNVKIEGPIDEVSFVLTLIQKAQREQVRRTALLPIDKPHKIWYDTVQ